MIAVMDVAIVLDLALKTLYREWKLESLLKLPKLTAWQKREINILQQRINDYVNA